MRVALVAFIIVAGCGGDSSGGGADAAEADARTSHESDAAGFDAAPDPWTSLVSRAWALEQEEQYFCHVMPVEDDLWISAFRPATTAGVVRLQLSWADSAAATGDIACGPQDFGPQMLFTSGIGSTELILPAGIAMKVPAGSFITLHAYVVGLAPETPLEGQVGVDIQMVTAADVVNEADMMYLGSIHSSWQVPSSGEPETVGGACSLPDDWTVFAIGPRSHRSGTHHHILHKRLAEAPGDVEETILDEDYSVYDQQVYSVDTESVANNQLWLTCTYVNDSGYTKVLGDSLYQEQCLAALYKYPSSVEPLYVCVEQD
jgi:hypothetical protein